ncbi:MAG: molybdopterin-dependent oxidoreductase [Acidobacteriia bacterium]|nr:molybdopterin-dependent oxidoreductase [Terriglobia bacterium]
MDFGLTWRRFRSGNARAGVFSFEFHGLLVTCHWSLVTVLMQRRDFIKISAITGATAALDSCGQPDVQLIRFIPEEDLTPGVATWKPSICTLCPAGCGTLVKVMPGDAEVLRNGRLGIIKMGLAKKIEGNPNHPINEGKLCPRGQAMLQVTYHPDRIKHPLKRTGPRGSGQFQEISWNEAIKELVAKLQELQATKQEGSLAFLTKPLRGQRRELVRRFLAAYGAPPVVEFEFFEYAVLRRANALSFGRPQLPTFDFAQSNYVLCLGADFLGTWNSPVAQSIAYGQMRQGRPGQRGKFVMVEPRVSQTGANADEWIPARPGTEGVLALGLAHVVIDAKLRPAAAAGRAGNLIPGWSEGLRNFVPAEVEKQTGVPSATVVRLAREMVAHPPAVTIVGDAAVAQTNGLRTALAVNALNALLGSVEQPGGILFTPQPKLSQPNRAPEGPSLEGSYPAFSRLVDRILQPMRSGVSSGPLTAGGVARRRAGIGHDTGSGDSRSPRDASAARHAGDAGHPAGNRTSTRRGSEEGPPVENL